jgi:ATP-dependent protease ClpP protease subunit
VPMPNIRFVNKGNKRGEIWLYDQVGEGWFGGMSAKTFVAELQKLGKVDVINLHINSPGGSVFDGVAIYNSLKSHPARIEVDVDALAASIASVIAMAGDEIRIAENAMMMIHDPTGVAVGGAEEMRKTADLLDQIKDVIVSTYVKRTKKENEIRAMMAEETWMTGGDAVDMGFADLLTPSRRSPPAPASTSPIQAHARAARRRAAQNPGHHGAGEARRHGHEIASQVAVKPALFAPFRRPPSGGFSFSTGAEKK